MLAEKVDAFVDEGVVLWASGTNVMGRTHSEITGTLGEPFVAISGVTAKFIRMKASPTKKEYVLGVQDTSGNLRAYHSTDGINWTFDWTVNIGDGNVARFDVVYEQLTGRGMIIYRGRILSARTTFYYRIWNSTAWTAQTEMRSSSGGHKGNIVGLNAASRPNSNQIGIVFVDDLFMAVAAHWSGTAWTFSTNAITSTAPRYPGFTGLFPPLMMASVAFETTSGDMLAVSGINTADELHYITRSAAGTWSAVSALNTLSGYSDYAKLDPNPSNNEIALTSCTVNPNGAPASYKCDFLLWSGTAFGTVLTDDTGGPIVDGDLAVSTIFLVDGANRAAVAIYDDFYTPGLDWSLSTNGGAFAFQTANQSSPIITAHKASIKTIQLSDSTNQALVLISDVGNNLYLKRVSLSGTNVSFSSAGNTTSAEITQGSNLLTSSNFETTGISLQLAPSSLTISSTSANTIEKIRAGSTSYIANPACTGEGSCNGYVLKARGKTAVTVNSITLTQNGTMNLANSSGWQLGVDTDGNPNNGLISSVNGTISGSTIVFNFGTPLSISAGQTYYIFPRATFGSNPYPSSGDTINLSIAQSIDVVSSGEENLIGFPSVKGIITPNILSYTNQSDAALSNSGANCIDCGGRLGPATFAEDILIEGFGFGSSPSTISISGTSSNNISPINIKSWSNTQVIFSLDSSIALNNDSDFGLNYGGPDALFIAVSGQTSNTLDFYLFPQITGIVSPSSLSPDGAKEYSALDTDGIITILGTRLGSTASSSLLTILGCSQTTCVSPPNSVYTSAWSNTSITARVPTIISDNLYSGNIKIVRNFPLGATPSTSTYANTFYIRPRVLSILPITGDQDSSITITGNHLCQPLGVCPTGSVGVDSNINTSPQFSTLNRITLAGEVSTYFNSWTDTSIQTQVPTLANSGDTYAETTAGGYNAGSLPFTVTFSASANSPTSLVQYAGASSTIVIPTGGSATSTSIRFGGVISVGVTGTSTSRLAIEVLPVGSPFVCGAGACASEYYGAWVPNIASIDCRIISNNCSVNVSLGNNAYHARARTELFAKGVTYYSSWVSYPTPIPNLETEADFWIDNGIPSISNLSNGTPGTNSASISWDTNEKADTLVQINKTGIFTDSCISADGCTGLSLSLVLTRTVTIKNLSTNTNYFYRVRSRDSAGNTAWSSIQTFKTLAISKPSKTLYFHVISKGGILGANASSSQNFTIKIPEANPEFESIFIDLRGMYSTSGIEPKAGISISVNGETPVVYQLPGGSNIVSPWRIYHKLLSLNISPIINTITVTSLEDTQLSGISGNVISSYIYTP
jgi:hypothetical protein